MNQDKMKALTFHKFGGSEVLNIELVYIPEIKKGEVLVENKAIGLNYADIYRRKGNYPLKGQPPYIAGYEGAGVVVKSLSGMYKVGDRVAYADVPFANAEFIKVHEDHVIPIPDDADYKIAASILLQGMTAEYLAHDSHPVRAGETILVHAASGGVGQILTQICKTKGAKVFGLSRSPSKLEVVKNCGADEALVLNDGWVEHILSLTNDKGVDVVYDSVGSTLEQSFEVTREKGHVVFYGMSGGDPKPVDPRMLMDTSKTLTGGDLWSFLVNKEERIRRSSYLFDLIARGKLKIKDPVIFKLSDGRKAHEYLEGGKSSSKVIIVP
jgi:NADPH2:quinone reductase